MDFSRVDRIECVRAEPETWEVMHNHPDLEMNLVLTGGMTLLLGNELRPIEPGRLVVFWAARPHKNIEIQPGTTFYYVHIPMQHFLPWSLQPNFRRMLLEGSLAIEQDPRKEMIDRLLLAQWAVDLADDPVGNAPCVLKEMEARLYRFSRNIAQFATPPSGQVSSPHWDAFGANKAIRMLRFLADSYEDPISIADVANHAGLHPNYASTLFRENAGMTIQDYVTRLRIGHAQGLLSTTEQSVTEVAFASGFGSVGRFHKVFKRICGDTPRRFRAGIRAIKSGPGQGIAQ